jgi:hypothetical protein
MPQSDQRNFIQEKETRIAYYGPQNLGKYAGVRRFSLWRS